MKIKNKEFKNRVKTAFLLVLAALFLLSGCEKWEELFPKGELIFKWKRQTGARVIVKARVMDGQVFTVSDNNQVFAFDQQTGKLAWKFSPVEKVIAVGTLQLGKGLVYFSALGGQYYALDAATGKVRWKTDLGINAIMRALLQEGKLYVPTSEIWPGKFRITPKNQAKMIVLDALTGEKEGEFISENYLLGTPLIVGDTIYIAGTTRTGESLPQGGFSRIYALDMKNGYKVLWQILTKDGFIKSLYAESGILSYVGYSDYIVGLDTVTGREMWRYQTGNWVSAFTGSKGRIIFGVGNNKVVSLNMSNGRRVWKYVVVGDRLLTSIKGRPQIVDGTAYWINRDNGLFSAVDEDTGEVIWRTQTEITKKPPNEPEIAGNMVFISSFDGNIYAYEMK